MTTSDDRTLDPGSIASASFTTVRRGLDPNEVRSYLQRLSAEVRALAEREAALRLELDQLKAEPSRTGELDEAIVAAWLGEEAARVLTTARDAAAQVRGKAQGHADQLREEVATEVGRVREEAHTEAAQLRDEVAAEVARRREESLAEAEVEIETARQEGRSMVSEARAVRERMLADLARRRDGARAQLTALRGERDRIVNAIEATRDHLDRLMDDLRAASPDDDRELPPVPYEQDLRAVTSTEPRLTLVRPLHPVHQDRQPDGDPAAELAVVDGEPPAGDALLDPTSSTVVLGEMDVDVAPDDTRGEQRLVEDPAAPEPVAPERVVEQPVVDEASPTDDLDEPLSWAADETELGAGSDQDDDSERPSVDDLFARIRAARSDAVAPADSPTEEVVLPPSEEAGGDTDEDDEPLDHDTRLLRARNAAVEPVRATLARQLKRALADEQNEVFDRLRRVTKVDAADDVLGTAAEHAERYRASGEDAVWAAALAGAASTSPDAATAGALESALERHRVLDDVLDEVTLEVAVPLRERLEASLAGAEGEPDEATNLLRNAYREWKAQRLDELAIELVLSAYGRGAFAATPPDAAVRWVIDPSVPGCRGEAANVEAGPTPAGEAFPTGHRHPPAHAGCRCIIEVAHG